MFKGNFGYGGGGGGNPICPAWIPGQIKTQLNSSWDSGIWKCRIRVKYGSFGVWIWNQSVRCLIHDEKFLGESCCLGGWLALGPLDRRLLAMAAHSHSGHRPADACGHDSSVRTSKVNPQINVRKSPFILTCTISPLGAPSMVKCPSVQWSPFRANLLVLADVLHGWLECSHWRTIGAWSRAIQCTRRGVPRWLVRWPSSVECMPLGQWFCGHWHVRVQSIANPHRLGGCGWTTAKHRRNGKSNLNQSLPVLNRTIFHSRKRVSLCDSCAATRSIRKHWIWSSHSNWTRTNWFKHHESR